MVSGKQKVLQDTRTSGGEMTKVPLMLVRNKHCLGRTLENKRGLESRKHETGVIA